MDRKYAFAGLLYALLGMVLGIYMAASHNHGQLVTHAHIMLLGFVVSFIYAVCHKLWLGENLGLLARLQFYAHQLGVVLMVVGLFLLYGQLAPAERLEPLLSSGSLLVLAALIAMIVLFSRAPVNAPIDAGV